MTTMTLKIEDTSQDIIEAFTIMASHFKGVSFEIDKEETKEEVLSSFRTTIKDIASGEAIENAISSEDFLKEISHG